MGLQGEAARVDQKGCNTVLVDRIMALAGPKGSPVRVVLAGHKDSQAGPKVGLEKVVLAGYKAAQPGYMVNPEHEFEPQEWVNVKDSHTHHTDTEKCTWVYHPVHNAKNTGGWDIEGVVRPRGSIFLRKIDTPQERCSPA